MANTGPPPPPGIPGALQKNVQQPPSVPPPIAPPPGAPPPSGPPGAPPPPPPPPPAGTENDGAAPQKKKPAKKKKPRSLRRKMNPQHIRKIILSHRDMASRHANADKVSYLGALKYLPFALYKWLENIPNPWEGTKDVKVVYHLSGALSIVDQVPKVAAPEYMAKWGAMWTAMQEEKRDRRRFRRLVLPAFDDEEQFLEYSEVQGQADPIPCVDTNVQAKTSKEWQVSASEMLKLRKMASPLLETRKSSLFNQEAFETSKALHAPLPQGPKYEPLFPTIGDEDIHEFNAPDRIIYRGPIKNETRVAFPHLYNDRPRQVSEQKIEPLSARGKLNSIDLFDSKTKGLEDLGPAFLEEFEPSTSGIQVYNSPAPFNKLCGKLVRPQDVNLIDWYRKHRPRASLRQKTRNSYQKLLKVSTKRALHRQHTRHGDRRKRNLIQNLAKTKFFAETQLDWLEVGLQLLRQGYTTLQLLIHKRALTFLHLDYNFNLKPTKTLTTKERKRSRFGHSFHLVRELLKLVKLIVDAQCQYRMGNCDAFELADALQYIFNHVGQLTGIYRYKYKVMHQISTCKDLKHLIYEKFNQNLGKGPGCGIWQPSWRVWISLLRGMVPLLELWLGNLLTRQFEGREKKPVHTVTKQRLDSNYDVELRASALHEILDMMPPQLRQSRSKIIMAHLSEAWRCWKANVPWSVEGLPQPVTEVIQRYIKAKADNYINATQTNRDRLARGATVEKAIAKKNVGRLTRLWMRAEQERQFEYLEEGPWMDPEDAVSMFTTMAQWLRERKFSPIDFPATAYKNDTKILVLALEGLRENYSLKARLNQTQREELALIEQAYDNPNEALTRIKKQLLTQRVFREVDVSLMDYYSYSIPVYEIDSLEKITDAYLDQYLWYEADKRQLFPNWIKPSDELSPVLAYKWCQGINNLKGIWDTDQGQSTVHLQTSLDRIAEKMDLTVLNRLLKLIVDPSIADYMTSKMNVMLNFKDMSHINAYGLIRGLQFGSFVLQYYGLMVDLLILGIPRALEMASGEFTKFEDSVVEQAHPIRAYCRYFDKIYMVFRFSSEEAEDILRDYLDEHPEPDYEAMKTYNNAKCWPRDERMQLMDTDVQLALATFWEIQSRVPHSVAQLEWKSSFVSVYSIDNPAILLNFQGFEIRLLPKIRDQDNCDRDAVWNLVDAQTQERTARAFLKVSSDEIEIFNNRVRQILMSSGSTTFTKIVNKWNTALLGFFTYFREAAVATPQLLDVLVRNENRVQTKVKMGLNSKMPSRFPPCVFYAPKELGGLGMLSASHILIPASDLKWSQETDSGITHFKAGMSHPDGNIIPNVFRYVPTWESEILDSQLVWEDYAQKRKDALEHNRRINLEDLEDSWDRGLPRVNTLFQKNRHTLAYDKGYRARQEFRRYQIPRFNSFWWTNTRHDGQLWNLNTYRSDMIQALGGINTILEHSLFKGTGFTNWEGLFWEQNGGFEDSMRFKKLTNAQRSGLSQIPNRRFTLWWSPTINRANVYVGYLVQLDLTGIFLHGKIPTLKISLVQVFRAHLWQKIHESLIIDMCQVFDREMDALQINEVTKLPLHPRKSYRMTSSAADILLTSSYRWNVSKPSLLHDSKDSMDFATTDKFWIDIQLRYGDYDSHDVTRYARAKFLDYTSDGVSNYPSATGVMIVVDLAYNTFDAYGNWIPGLKRLVQLALAKIIKANPALHVLRERIRKALQLYQAQTTQQHLTSSNFGDMFGKTSQFFVDDSMVYRTVNHKTINGNFTAKPVNGAVFILNPLTGQLYLKLVHASTWAGQKKLNALAKWKTAEEVGLLLKSLNATDLPKQLIITSKGLLDPLEVHMLDFPNIAIRPSELHLPFRGILQHPQISKMVSSAQNNQMVVLNVFDGWLQMVSPATAFSRLILVLRSLQLNPERTKSVLYPDSSIKTQEHHLWPTLGADQWIKVETELSDLVLNDYGRKNNVNIQGLTQSEIRDIILGQPITIEPRDVREIEAPTVPTESSKVTSTVQNVHGEEMRVVTTSNYEQQQFLSKTNWRSRAIDASSLYERAKHIYVQGEDLSEAKTTFVFARNLVAKFVMVADVRSQVVGYLFGKSPKDNPMIKEVRCIAMVPQLSSSTNWQVPLQQPEVEGMELLGLIHTQVQDLNHLSAHDLTKIAELGWDSSKILVSACFTPGSVTLAGYSATDAGIQWGKQNKDLISETPPGFSPELGLSAQMILSDRFKGGFRVPHDNIWNFSFFGAYWTNKVRFSLKIGIPLPFFHDSHRPIHFQTFAELENPEGAEDVF